MLPTGVLVDSVALHYGLPTRRPAWERTCAQMAVELPAGAQRILDLGCGPGNSTAPFGPGALGGDYSLAMLHLSERPGASRSRVCRRRTPTRDLGPRRVRPPSVRRRCASWF